MDKKKHFSLLILAIFLLGAFCFPSLSAHASLMANDISGHWAQSQIEKAIEQNIVSGYPDGSFQPDKNISRAEFFTMVNRAFGFEEKTNSSFTDVKSTDWFAEQIAIANAAGYVSGYEDGTIKPNNKISRQEVAVIITRLSKTSTSAANSELLSSFKDAAAIPAWAREAIASTVSSGIMNGYPDQTFKAQNLISRAESVVVLNKAKEIKIEPEPAPVPAPPETSGIFEEAGTYGPASGTDTIEGDVTVSVSDVILQNTTITGDLTISEAIGDGDAELNNVKVNGTTYINGGGENSITINQSELNKVLVDKKDGKIRIVLSKDSIIQTLVVDSGLKLTGSGKITDLTINSSGVEIEPEPINKPTIKSGLSARVAGKTIRGSSSGGGGGGGTTVSTANVSTEAQLTAALANSNITTINLTANITANPIVTRSLTMKFGAYTLTGNLTFDHSGSGTSVLSGDAGNRIIGNLSVDTPNASFNNGVAVSETVTVTNVAPASWTESADGNTLTITDPDGATITIIGSPGAVTVTQDAGGNLTLTVNAGANISSITTSAPVNIEVEAGAAVTNISAEAGSDGTTITNNGTTGTLTVKASINLVANVAPTNTTVGAGGSVQITGDDAARVTRVDVSAISVDKTTLTLTAGGATGTITATVLPAGATNKSVTWTSSNEAVATVAGGVVTPLTAGTTTITVTTVDGSFAKTTLVTVEAPAAGIDVTLQEIFAETDKILISVFKTEGDDSDPTTREIPSLSASDFILIKDFGGASTVVTGFTLEVDLLGGTWEYEIIPAVGESFAPGSYRLGFNKAGYGPEHIDFEIEDPAVAATNSIADATPNNIDVALDVAVTGLLKANFAVTKGGVAYEDFTVTETDAQNYILVMNDAAEIGRAHV